MSPARAVQQLRGGCLQRYTVQATDAEGRTMILATSPSPFYVLGLARRTREDRPDLRVAVVDDSGDIEQALIDALAEARRVA